MTPLRCSRRSWTGNLTGPSRWKRLTNIWISCRSCAAGWRRAWDCASSARFVCCSWARGPTERRTLLILPAAFRLEKFEYLEKEEIDLAYGVAGIVQRRQQDYAQTYRRSMTQGVVLCVLAVVPLFGAAMLSAPDFWVVATVNLLLAIVAGAVQLFVRAGMTQGSFDKLLQTGEYSVCEKWTNRRVGWFAGAYWCLVTAVYLGVSFRYDNWEESWQIWAVAGLVFAALYSAIRAWADRERR